MSVQSPDGRIQFNLRLDDRSAPSYSITVGDEFVVSDSRLGIRFRDHPSFDSNLKLISSDISSSEQTWELPWGERRVVHDRHNELVARFASIENEDWQFVLRARVFDDGVGFRYEVPKLRGLEQAAIIEEITEFRLQPGSTAWWIPGRQAHRYEYLYRETPLKDVVMAHTPFTLKTPQGTYLSLHEAALIDYSGYALHQRGPNVFRTDLAPGSDGVKVHARTPFRTPWRTIQIAAKATGLINSDLLLNLNEPNALGDVSWVEPGKYVGVWWSIHRGLETWRSGPRHGATTENTLRYIDFAARHGIDGVLVEGWNVGWDGGGWFADGTNFSFTTPHPDFDLTRLASDALARGVRLIGYHETAGAVSHYESQMRDAFALYKSLGVRQVKTGYVSDAGEIQRVDDRGLTRREWHDGQFMVNHYLRNVIEAAKYQISINTHEPVKDTGLRRTYPNWISREGARGQEYNAWGEPPNPPSHVPMLAFTRLLAGPMDFTPGIFELQFTVGDRPRAIQSTIARQLALYVVIYSPIQMVADLPENYEARPEAFQFILDVPTDWEQSIALDGEPGEFVAIARKRRGGDDWFLGAVTNEQSRELNVSLNFLSDGMNYTAEIYRDGTKADWRENPYDIIIERRVVTARETLKLPLAGAGGAAVRFVPATQ